MAWETYRPLSLSSDLVPGYPDQMANDLGIEITQIKPLARRVCALDDAYPWGDGIASRSYIISSGGPNACNPTNPDRAPRKWPDNLDWRNPGFQPWSQSTATPSPGGYEGLFVITDPSGDWPEPKDNLATVRLYPEQNPDKAWRSTEWRVYGLSGGTIWATCAYVRFADATPDEPARSLLQRSRAIIPAGKDAFVSYQGERFVYPTWLQYDGPFKYFGPINIRNLARVDQAVAGCENCAEVDFQVALPQLGISSGLPGGQEVSQINGAVLGYGGQFVDGCRWGRQETFDGVDPDIDVCGANALVFPRWGASLELEPTFNQATLRLNYYCGLPYDPTDGCSFSWGGGCCRRVDEMYGDFSGGLTGGEGHSASYTGNAVVNNQTCATLKGVTFPLTLGKVNESGQPWAGRFPETVTLSVA